MTGKPMNPLLSGQSTDSGLQVILHPLPILNLSDRITRSSVRGQPGPIVVALLGQQSGLGITVEESFDCRVVVSGNGEVGLDTEWFKSRLEQMRLVYKQPQLDLVGWGTLLPESGPTPAVLPIHKFLLSAYNESAILLGFQPESVLNPVGGRLPITMYESNYEADGLSREAEADGEDKEMKDGDAVSALALKFRELPYSIETGEAEMIGMAFVHKGAANATAASTSTANHQTTSPEPDVKGKRLAVGLDEEDNSAPLPEAVVVLSREEQDLIAALSAKRNAIQMLKRRVDLFIAYLQRLPPSRDLSSPSPSNADGAERQQQQRHAPPEHTTGHLPLSNNVLRAIQALQTNLGLLLPTTTTAATDGGGGGDGGAPFAQELLREANDVHVVALMGDVLASLDEVREVGRQFSVVESAKAHKARMADYGGPGMGGGGGGGGGAGGGGGGGAAGGSYAISSSGDIMHVMH